MLFRQYVKEHRLLTLGYFLLLAVNLVASILYWPDLRDNIPQFMKLVPFEPMRRLIGQIEEEGYWAYFAFQHLWKGAGVFGVAAAGLMGSGLVAREADNRTAELLLSRPVSRTRILLTRWCTGVVLLVVPFFAVATLGVLMAPRVGEELGWKPLLLGTAYTSLFIVAVYTVTVWLSARFTHQLKAAIVVLGVMLLQFAFYMIKVLWDWSVYNVVDLDVQLPIGRGDYPWMETGAMTLFIGGFLLLAWAQFRLRDF